MVAPWSCRKCLAFVSSGILLVLVVTGLAHAQSGVTLRGRLTHSITLEPVAGATVVLEELKREVQSGPDGSYSFANVPPGRYHVAVRANGFTPKRSEVSVGTSDQVADLVIDPELHYSEVISVSPESRSQFESYQPTSVLTGQDLFKQLEGSLGATLQNQPGVAERSFGPSPARPVIRGLDGDRVLILEDGQRMGDLSSQSGDHGITVNPAAARRIEVVRGPATLLHGASAIGGLVNVISETIPSERLEGTRGGFNLDFGSAATEAGVAGDVLLGNKRFALHVGGGGRRSGDVSTPEGDIDNTQSRAGFASVGGAWTGEKGYFGGSYGYQDTKYGIPIVEGGDIQLTPRR
ncbi:MAG: TonB-dependent receptor plug domain-containing protein, partial [Acidimicrobiia bacterium]